MRPVENPPNPWHSVHREWLGPPPPARLEVFEETAKSIVTENDSPDVGFRFGVNPYRGCFHGCLYCYARPTHQYLDLGAGTDFERKIIVKVNAPELLEAAFRKRAWKGDSIALSGNTDCYQPLEAHYRLTRGMLEVCRRFRNPVGVITKSVLVRRDRDVLADLARIARVRVFFSIPFLDDAMARAIEPSAPAPSDRFAAMRALHEAGVPVGVMVAPILPGLNDSQIAGVLARARDCGAQWAGKILLRLPAEVKDVFVPRLREAYPDSADKVLNAVREMRQGVLYKSGFGARVRGEGERWAAIEAMFDLQVRRLGYRRDDEEGPTTFRRPGAQLGLLDDH